MKQQNNAHPRKQSSKKRHYLLILLVVFLVGGGYLYWGNTALQTTNITVTDDKLPAAFQDFTIVQISDLHNTRFGSKQQRLLNTVAQQHPDIIVITGDFFDSYHPNLTPSLEFIDGAVDIAPVYYVPGNHESRRPEEYAQLKERMKTAGVFILDNKRATIEKEDNAIQLCGINDPNFFNGSSQALLTELHQLTDNTTDYTILLAHRPNLRLYAQANVQLVLSGHAHGGQFRFLQKGFIAPNQGLLPEYTSGLYELDGTQMVVSRGLGNSIIPMRVNNRPEVVTITLQTQT